MCAVAPWTRARSQVSRILRTKRGEYTALAFEEVYIHTVSFEGGKKLAVVLHIEVFFRLEVHLMCGEAHCARTHLVRLIVLDMMDIRTASACAYVDDPHIRLEFCFCPLHQWKKRFRKHKGREIAESQVSSVYCTWRARKYLLCKHDWLYTLEAELIILEKSEQ